jgi:HAD superfamily hydrolase (TIGR01509 family)
MAKAVIFDIDGTLIDSVDLHAQAWVEAFADHGHVLDFETVRGQIGKGGDQLMPVFLSREALDADGAALERHRSNIFKSRYLHRVAAFADVRALFERILADGLRVALASSAKGEELEAYKRIARIDDLVDRETSSEDVAESKPHPDIFDAAIRKLGGIARADILVVGDTPYDAEAAERAGLRTIGLTCGGWSEKELRRAGCIAVYDGPSDLLARYDGSPLAS